MFAITMTALAASFASLTNFFFRKGSDYHASTNAYLFFYFLSSFLIAISLHPQIFSMTWNPTITLIGGIAGLLNLGLLHVIFKALKHGPSGLTFAFQNAGSVFPNLILFGLFGPSFGFLVTYSQIAGMCLVLLGLYFGGKQSNGGNHVGLTGNWYKYAAACFLLQMLVFTLFQWRCLLYCTTLPHILIPSKFAEAEDAWFLPGFFGLALLLQGFLLWREKKPRISEVVCGGCAGLANGTSSFFLLLAIQWAAPVEKGIVFPLFAVLVIIICSLWSKKLYGENINKTALSLCSLGIFVSSL